MATFNFSSGSTINVFVPGRDNIALPAGTSARDLWDFSQAGADLKISTSLGDMVVKNLTYDQLVSGSLTFADGALFLAGSVHGDALAGGTGGDYLDGKDGDDTLTGLAGEDKLYGGLGNDTLDGGDGFDDLFGNDGNDSLTGGASDDSLRGGAGDDTLDGGAGYDSVFFGDASGPVTVNLASGTAIGAGIGTDTLIGVEAVFGSSHADTLNGDANSSYFAGGLGNDTLTGGAGVDSFGVSENVSDTSVDTITDFTAGNGGDRIDIPVWNMTNYTEGANPFVSGHARLTQSGASTLLELDFDGLEGLGTFQTVAILNNVVKGTLVASNFGGFDPNPTATGNVATEFADSLTGTAGNDTIDALAGNDSISGLAGDDSLSGGLDDDVIYGGEGNDSLDGGAGIDYLWGGPGHDMINGGEGVDWVYFYDAASGVTASLLTGLATGGGGTDVLISIENLLGTDYIDTLTGDANRNSLDGHNGNDTLSSGQGDDYIQGGQGDDRIDGGEGRDVAYYIEAVSGITASLLTGLATGGADSDVLISMEGLSGSGFADSLGGDASNNDLYGLGGNDTLFGAAGNDALSGDLGNDLIDGGDGTDVASFSGKRSDYTLTQTATGWTVSSAIEGTDALQNIERLEFADTNVGLDVNGVGGQAYRIYQAAFNRTPDAGGLGYWIDAMDVGADLITVAAGFVNSAEFKALYGSSPTNSDIVNKFYDNVLHRPAETAGFNYWLGELDRGVSVAQVLASFSESAENQAALLGVIGNGFVYTPVFLS